MHAFDISKGPRPKYQRQIMRYVLSDHRRHLQLAARDDPRLLAHVANLGGKRAGTLFTTIPSEHGLSLSIAVCKCMLKPH